ncbi:hypothetical protein KFK09_024858 [Dendrobium nobile]|uniref:Uncharacterized protein n=1 Tax=Dendrobium nobile TaxID=94219 RepID=A0A8T3AKE1_DENNO|nr:hypothetical protein KFK09_024858 [Dendrobium nobile]
MSGISLDCIVSFAGCNEEVVGSASLNQGIEHQAKLAATIAWRYTSSNGGNHGALDLVYFSLFKPVQRLC